MRCCDSHEFQKFCSVELKATTMAGLYCAISLCFLSVTLGKSLDVNSPPTWPNAYTVSGTLKLPYAEIVEPFQAFFDGQNGRSRIDFYGGKVTCYLKPSKNVKETKFFFLYKEMVCSV